MDRHDSDMLPSSQTEPSIPSTESVITSEEVPHDSSQSSEYTPPSGLQTTTTTTTTGLSRTAAQHRSYESLPSDISSTSAGTSDDRHSSAALFASHYSNEGVDDDISGNDDDSKSNNYSLRSMSPDTAYRIPPAPPSTPASQTSTISLSFEAIVACIDGPPTAASSMVGTPFSPLPDAGGLVLNDDMVHHRHYRHNHTISYDASQPTPAPTTQHSVATPKRTQGGSADATATPKALRPSAPLPEDFSKWFVGERYELVRILGRGSYGEVAQAIDRRKTKANNGDVAYVAIKRIQSPFEQQLDAIRLYREIHILRRIKEGGEGTTNTSSVQSQVRRHHDCIIQLVDVVQPAALNDFHELYLVFEYVDTDLYKLIMSPQYLTTEHIQMFLYQMLAAANYLHSFNVIHRDLKPANILLNEDCSLKICDFGLARIVGSDAMSSSKSNSVEPPTKKARTSSSFPPIPKANLTRQLTKHVVTRWYRAPELILIQPYTSAVDIWSIGCIFAELLSMQEGNVPGYQDRKPLFPGGTCYPLSGEGDSIKADERLDQLSVIFSVIGSPSADDIEAIGKASEYIKALPKTDGKPFEVLYPAADSNALDLLKKMLQFNPSRRVTAEEALEHEFFRGTRRKELERKATSPLECPDFLESDQVDLKLLKQRTYEEVLWYRDHDEHRKEPRDEKETQE